MKVLVLHAHPSQTSFVSHMRDVVLDELAAHGHEIRHHDLVAEGFNPAFTADERLTHTGDPAEKLQRHPELRTHVDDLQWCDALVLVYPTWWSGQPAVLKGWFDRVLMCGVAWRLPEGASRIEPMLTNVRRMTVVTTHGSTKWVNALQGEPGKRTALRSVRLMFGRRCRTSWLAMYGLDRADIESRVRFERRVRRAVSRLR
ncbi:MAG: NAD(P)H-dependent oxidoreductase [Ilumatobacteraceae bacterium]